MTNGENKKSLQFCISPFKFLFCSSLVERLQSTSKPLSHRDLLQEILTVLQHIPKATSRLTIPERNTRQRQRQKGETLSMTRSLMDFWSNIDHRRYYALIKKELDGSEMRPRLMNCIGALRYGHIPYNLLYMS